MNTENNKKIAEFMGINLKGGGKSVFDDPNLKYFRKSEYKKDGLCKWCGNDVSHGHNLKCYVLDVEKLNYHNSWNLLMEVVEKINLIDDYKYTVIIKSMDVQIYNNVSGKIIFESECKWQPDELLKSVYEAIISFIDWYNKNGAKEN